MTWLRSLVKCNEIEARLDVIYINILYWWRIQTCFKIETMSNLRIRSSKFHFVLQIDQTTYSWIDLEKYTRSNKVIKKAKANFEIDSTNATIDSNTLDSAKNESSRWDLHTRALRDKWAQVSILITLVFVVWSEWRLRLHWHHWYMSSMWRSNSLLSSLISISINMTILSMSLRNEWESTTQCRQSCAIEIQSTWTMINNAINFCSQHYAIARKSSTSVWSN